MRKTFVIFWVLNGVIILNTFGRTHQELAHLVLERLYHSIGNYQVEIPTVKIVGTENQMAAYHPGKNIIFLENKALRVCGTFGKDSIDAIAFLLGHELTHAYQKLGWATNFMAYNHAHDKSIAHEKAADIQGAFGAALAEFNTLEIINPLIERLYDAYNLIDIHLPGYPTFQERKQTAGEVKVKVYELWDLYQYANYLNVLGHHKMAALSYEYILDFYIGKEIYNNLGILYANLAMTFCGKNADPYIYPFEMDADSRLRNTRAEKLIPLEIQNRTELLANASHFFEKAMQLDKRYERAFVNQLAVKVQGGEYNEVIRMRESGKLFASLRRFKASVETQERANMVVAIAYALSSSSKRNYQASARRLFEQLKNASNGSMKRLAEKNEALLSGEKWYTPNSSDCSLNGISTRIDGVTPLKFLTKQPQIYLDTDKQQSLYIEKMPNSTVYVSQDGDSQFVLQRIQTAKYEAVTGVRRGGPIQELIAKLEKDQYIYIAAGKKQFVHLLACRLIFLVEGKRIQEWVTYFN